MKRIRQLDIPVYDHTHFTYCLPDEVRAAVRDNYGDKGVEKFNECFGVNTCSMLEDGTITLYPCDVERALDMMITGRKMRPEEWD